MRRGQDQPTLITSVPESNEDEYERRRKKYAIMMALRAVAVLGAALTYHLSMILAMIFVVAGIVLPWCAVLVANDGPAKKRAPKVSPVQARVERALPPGNDRIVDG